MFPVLINFLNQLDGLKIEQLYMFQKSAHWYMFVDLFKKGGDVTLHQGSVIEFILTDAVDVPVN